MNFVVEELIRAILRGPDPPPPQNRRLLDNCSPSTSMKPKRAPSYLGNPKAQLKGMGQSEIQIRPRIQLQKGYKIQYWIVIQDRKNSKKVTVLNMKNVKHRCNMKHKYFMKLKNIRKIYNWRTEHCEAIFVILGSRPQGLRSPQELTRVNKEYNYRIQIQAHKQVELRGRIEYWCVSTIKIIPGSFHMDFFPTPEL